MTLAELLQRLEGARAVQGGHEARCPAHDDHTASLSVGEGEGGKILLRCHAGCTAQQITAALGLTMRDLFPAGERRRRARAPVVARYDYVDEGGQLLYQVERRADKSFIQRRPDGNGGWAYKLQGVKRVPYHLDELVAANGVAVFVAEGEKDVDNLRALGLVATCNPGGAGKWRKDWARWFEGRQVVVLPDNDEPGREHAERVAQGIAGAAAGVWVVQLPGLPEKGDVSDWLAQGGTLDGLRALVRATPRWQAPPQATQDEAEDDHKPTPHELGKEFLKAHSVITAHSEIRIYRDGAYRQEGGHAVQRWVQRRLGCKARKRDGFEVVYWVENETRVDAGAIDPPGLLNVENGLLDWQTGELKPHTPEHLSTIQLATAWDAEAYDERADRFFDEVLPDAETRAIVEEFIGYCLWPDTRYQKTLMLTGEAGNNGKSTALGWIEATLGKVNVSSISLQDLEQRFRPAELVGKLANICADLPKEALKDAGMFKALVTGDAVTVERKHREPFTYRNRTKFAFSANEIPGTRDRSPAFFRRWIIVPFPGYFPEGSDQRDENLPEALQAPRARSYLLRLAVEGLRRLRGRGYFLDTPATKEAMAEYRRDADHIVAFWEDQLEYVGGDDWVSQDQVYGDYKRWCERAGTSPMPANVLAKRLRSLDPRLTAARRGGRERRRWAWIGLRVIDSVVGRDSPEPDHGGGQDDGLF